MKFDLILTNPPFQDRGSRGRTPHKLWIEFTEKSFENFLTDGGILCQVSPASFQSPSNRILDLMKRHETQWLNLDTAKHFEGVGSSFADYAIRKAPNPHGGTRVMRDGQTFDIALNEDVMYLPNDLSDLALEIHRKVIFDTPKKLGVERDYVTCHNIRLKLDDTLSKTTSDTHVHPVLHTNRQVWWSTLRQDWADDLKVMWSRSGYTLPFFDSGVHGGTDMVYFVRVPSADAGNNLAAALNSKLFQYIFQSAKWSGFGNERVFDALPALDLDHPPSDADLYAMFGLTEEEVSYVEGRLAGGKRQG